jgi:hypothetical protein
MSDEALDHSVKIAHLTMLQGVITRMGSNSFTLKTLSISFGAAFIAVIASAKNPNFYYAIGAVVPIVMFWLMDAAYLRQERLYRRMYEAVRKDEEIELYSMDASVFSDDVKHAVWLALTWSVGWFYAAVLFGLFVISWLIIK